MEIIPGILEKKWEDIERKIELVKPFAKTIHIDLLDNKFAPNSTWMDPAPFKKYSGDVFFELHMMVENPAQYLRPFADAGFRRFLGHVERMGNVAEFVAQGQILGEVGLAIDGPTDIVDRNIPYQDVDCLLFMTIKAGFSGQKFTQDHLDKVKKARRDAGEKELPFFPIEVDGGVNDETIRLAKEAGATRFVTTSFLYKHEDPQQQYKKLQELLQEE